MGVCESINLNDGIVLTVEPLAEGKILITYLDWQEEERKLLFIDAIYLELLYAGLHRSQTGDFIIETNEEKLNRPGFTGGSKFEKLESLWNNKEGKDIQKKSVTRRSGWLTNTNMTTHHNGPVSIQLLKSSAMTPETLRKWVRKAEDAGEPLANGMTGAERIKQLERENKELRRTNEILKAAASFFGAELDRQHK